MASVVEAIDLTKRFGKTAALNDVSFSINEGEIVAFLGPSGCGKTTLLRCVAGLEKPDSGMIVVKNRVVFDSQSRVFVEPNDRNLGMIFQVFAIWPHMTVFANIAYPLKMRNLQDEEIRSRTMDTIRLMGLDGMENRYPAQLSGGQQQRVAIGRAIVMQPSVFLADEPMSNLDAKLAERLRFEVRALLKKFKITGIYVTHDQAEALAVADRIVVMKDGQIVEAGHPKELYTNPKNSFTAEFLGSCNRLEVKAFQKIDKELVLLSTDIGQVVAVSNPGFETGGKAAVAYVRDNVIRLSEKESDTTFHTQRNIFEGKILVASFMGNRDVYEVDVGSNKTIRVETPSRGDFAEGSDVKLSFDPQSVMVFQSESKLSGNN